MPDAIDPLKLIHGICILSSERDEALARMLSAEAELRDLKGYTDKTIANATIDALMGMVNPPTNEQN